MNYIMELMDAWKCQIFSNNMAILPRKKNMALF
jgi:hypothetical protein